MDQAAVGAAGSLSTLNLSQVWLSQGGLQGAVKTSGLISSEEESGGVVLSGHSVTVGKSLLLHSESELAWMTHLHSLASGGEERDEENPFDDEKRLPPRWLTSLSLNTVASGGNLLLHGALNVAWELFLIETVDAMEKISEQRKASSRIATIDSEYSNHEVSHSTLELKLSNVTLTSSEKKCILFRRLFKIRSAKKSWRR